MTNYSQSKVEAFLGALKDKCFFKDENTQVSILWYIAFYQYGAPNRRKAFRATGVVLLS